ncbi:MAG: 3-oxoacyl-ACP synthase [Candidatus Omnitrophica bacterium 4484_213]|nr:MAG: 3-oxoacyl-ACP synthase [Candidatus Omnitrophica bacterium 4484_213]
MDKKLFAQITGLGMYVPPKILTNADLEKMVDTSDEWITQRTGIKERHLVERERLSDLSVIAAREALQDADLKGEDLDLIIVSTTTPDMQFPSTSCLVQKELGAKKAACFDLAAACTGFIYGLSVANQFIISGTYKNILLIGGEVLSSITDWQDRSTCVLFGDGAGAVILEPTREEKGIISVYLTADGNFADFLKVPAGGSRQPATIKTVQQRLHFLKMKGNETFKVAVRAMGEAAKEALSLAGLSSKDVDCLIPHQANIRIIKAAAKRLGLDESKVFINVEKYGNMSSASSAVALYEAVKCGKVKQDSLVVMTAFGSGFTSGGCVIRW